MQTAKATLVILICVVLLGACGLRGPLYLPDENPDPKPATGQDSTSGDEEDNEEKKSDSG